MFQEKVLFLLVAGFDYLTLEESDRYGVKITHESDLFEMFEDFDFNI